MLALLSLARGPLGHSDLRSLLSIDEATLKDALRPLLRCLVSRVSLDFFHLELKSAVARRVQEADRNWAKETLSAWVRSFAGQAGPGTLPDYVLRHLVDQLIEEKAHEVLFSTILSRRWYEVRSAASRFNLEYAADLVRVRNIAAEGAPDWPVFCQACLLLAQLRTVAAGIPHSLIWLLVKLGRVELAESYLSLDTEHTPKTVALIRIADYFRGRKYQGKAARMLHQAEDELNLVDSPEKRCLLLDFLTSSYRDMGDLDRAKKLASDCRQTVSLISDEWKRPKAARNAISASVAAGQLNEALEFARLWSEEHDYGELLAPTAVPLAAKGQLNLLISALNASEHSVWKDLAFEKVIRNLAENGRANEARQVANASGQPADSLAQVCAGLTASGKTHQAVEVIEEIGLRTDEELKQNFNWFWRLLFRWRRTRRWLLARLPNDDRFQILAYFYRQQALKAILRNYSESLNESAVVTLGRKMDAATAISSTEDNMEARGQIVQWLVKNGAVGEAMAMTLRMQKEAEALEGRDAQIKARLAVSKAYAEASKWQEALEVLQPVLGDSARAHAPPTSSQQESSQEFDLARAHACKALASCGRYDEALELNSAIESLEWRALRLAELANLMLKSEEKARGEDIARRAEDLVKKVPEEKRQNVVRTVIGYTYADSGQTDHAIAMWQAITDGGERDKALDNLSFLLVEAGQAEAAMKVVLTISDWSRRQDALASLSLNLAHRNKWAEALSTVAKIDGSKRALTLSNCAEKILPRCEIIHREQWFTRFLEEARYLENFPRLDAFGRVGQIVQTIDEARAGTICDEALQTSQGSTVIEPGLYIGIAENCVEVGAMEPALAILRPGSVAVAKEPLRASRVLAQLGQWNEIPLLDSESGIPLINLLADCARIALARGERERAEQWVDRLRKEMERLKASDVPPAQAHLAQLLLLLGDSKGAQELAQTAYEGGIKAGDRMVRALVSRPLALAGSKDLALKSQAWGEEAIHPWDEGTVAEELAEGGHYQDAIETAQAVLEKLPEMKGSSLEKWARRSCIKALAKAEQPDLAAQAYSVDDDAEMQVDELLEIAQCYHRNQQINKMEETLKRALSVVKKAPAAAVAARHAKVAAFQAAMGYTEQARAELLNALRNAEAEGSKTFLSTLQAGATVLASLDGGVTLLEVLRALERVTVISNTEVPMKAKVLSTTH